MDYQNQRSRFKLPKAVIVICAIMVVLFIAGLSRELVGRHEVNKEIKRLSEQVKSMQDQNKELNDMVGSFQGDDFIEKEARLKLGLQKPGEKVVLIKRGGQTATNSLALAENGEISGNMVVNGKTEVSNPSLWWHYFFK